MYSAGIIFDGDDTLWETAPFYVEAKKEFFTEMAQLGFNAAEVEKVFQSIDLTNVAKFGFSKERFPTSMAETYRSFCKRYRQKWDKAVEDAMKDIGYSVFFKRSVLLDHAENVLAQLYSDYTLVLATKGDREIQQSRIEHSNLSRYFHASYILEQKTERELREIIIECNLDTRKSWAVGNSLKSDINPALRVGLRAIWIPYETWTYEEDVQLDSPHLYRAVSLDQILCILKRERALC